jgi:predicted N-formylglutamate amidohydrolase
MRLFPEAVPNPNHTEATVVECLGLKHYAPILVVCDHASNRVPAHLGNLGLAPDALGQHIGWDIGAAVVARRLADRLAATAVLSKVSRLVIDCNRPVGHPTSICPTSDGTVIPGNRELNDAQARGRAETYFYPYHGAIAAQLERIEATGQAAALVAVHSFTPCMAGVPRPWHVGVLWNRDPRLALPLIEGLRRDPALVVGDNEPYSGRQSNYTADLHAGACGRPHVSIEIRQDLLARDAAAQGWGDRLAELLAPLLALPENRVKRIFTEQTA